MDETTTATVGGSAGADSAIVQDNREGASGENAAQDTKTYTAEEFKAETDRRITEAVKTANAKAEADFAFTAEHEKWEKQSKMTATGLMSVKLFFITSLSFDD